jgi:ferritin
MKKIDSRNKFQFLNVDNFEIILKFLNFDDLAHFLRACEKSKSNNLKQTIRKLFQIFHKNQIQKSIEYLSSKRFHDKQKNSTNFLDKYLNFKTISLPKFVEHAIQTPHFRFVSHTDGFFSIEQKLKNGKQYKIMSIQKFII